jgi:hypothetical protein
MKLKGQISISRYSNARDMERPITIRIEDDDSSVEFLTVSLSYEEFALVMTGLSGVSCELDARGLDLVGTQRENKSEMVPVPDKFVYLSEKERLKLAGTLIEPFEVDGWRGRDTDMLNHYNQSKDGMSFKVTFVRYVERNENVGMS